MSNFNTPKFWMDNNSNLRKAKKVNIGYAGGGDCNSIRNWVRREYMPVIFTGPRDEAEKLVAEMGGEMLP